MLGITTLLGSLITAGVEGFKSWQGRKVEETNAKHQLALTKINAQTAKFMSDIAIKELQMNQDQDYDIQVLRNRSETWMDELIIVVWLAVFAMHFIPYTQPFMHNGWKSMGYVGVPWWMEFGMVGILISTLGLRGVFRDWIGKWGAKKSK